MDSHADIVLPADQQEGTASTFSRWLVERGEAVERNDPIAEVETDKVMVEIAAPASGVLAETLKAEGDEVEPGEVLGRIAIGAAAAVPAQTEEQAPAASRSTPTRASAASDSGGARLSPAVRRLLAEHGLDTSAVAGTGRGGRITARDVEAAAAAQNQSTGLASRRIPHDAMRKRIAGHMAASLATAPHVTSVFEADMQAVLDDLATRKPQFADAGVRLTMTAYLVRAACRALQAVPEVNARFHADALEVFDDINIGVGTALEDRGLIVPVLREVQTLDLMRIARALEDLIGRARSGELAPAEVQGGTFTISNHGVGGSLLAAPIVINQPQLAILGVGKLEKRAVVIEREYGDDIVVRPRAYVTLSIDHRALDAWHTNRFLSTFVETLEQAPAAD